MNNWTPIVKLVAIIVVAAGLATLGTQVLPAGAAAPSALLFASPLPPGPGGGGGGGGGGTDGPPPAVAVGELDDPSGGGTVIDPEGPTGFTTDFPPQAASVPVKIRVVNTTPPANLPPLGGGSSGGANLESASVGASFLFAAWKKSGDGSLSSFERAITINAPYDGQKAAASGIPEENVRLFMYNPAIHGWIPVGGTLDIYQNLVSGLVSNLSPFADGPLAGQTLFNAAMANPIQVKQAQESNGTTSFRFGPVLYVPPGCVPPGTHFEFGVLSDLPDTNYILVDDAYFFGAYFIDRSGSINVPNMKIPDFSELMTVAFFVPDHFPDQLDSLSQSDLTIVTVSPETGVWVDVEELGYPVTRIPDLLSVDVDFSGLFALAIRQPLETTEMSR